MSLRINLQRIFRSNGQIDINQVCHQLGTKIVVLLNGAEAKCLQCKPVSVYFGCCDWCIISALLYLFSGLCCLRV